MEPGFLYFSTLLGRRAIDGGSGAAIGRVSDLVVIAGEPFPRVETALIRGPGGRILEVRANMIEGWSQSPLVLAEGAEMEDASPGAASDRIRLVSEILDRQIVDVEGAKVVRVNDLHFLLVNGSLRLAHVDVGTRGLVRRMGWERMVDAVVGAIRPKAPYLTKEVLLPWKLIQPLDVAPGKIRLDVAQRLLATMHPSDLASVFEELDRSQRAELLGRMDVETAADALEEASPEVATELLEEITAERAADIVEEMQPDEAADVLSELEPGTREDVLQAMEAPEARQVQVLLAHSPRTAGGLMTPEILRLPPSASAADALAAVRWLAHEVTHLHEVFVVEEGKLIGTATLASIVAADPAAKLSEIAKEAPAVVGVETPLSQIADEAAKYNLLSVPVVDENGILQGAVTIDDVLGHMIHDG